MHLGKGGGQEGADGPSELLQRRSLTTPSSEAGLFIGGSSQRGPTAADCASSYSDPAATNPHSRWGIKSFGVFRVARPITRYQHNHR